MENRKSSQADRSADIPLANWKSQPASGRPSGTNRTFSAMPETRFRTVDGIPLPIGALPALPPHTDSAAIPLDAASVTVHPETASVGVSASTIAASPAASRSMRTPFPDPEIGHPAMAGRADELPSGSGPHPGFVADGNPYYDSALSGPDRRRFAMNGIMVASIVIVSIVAGFASSLWVDRTDGNDLASRIKPAVEKAIPSVTAAASAIAGSASASVSNPARPAAKAGMSPEEYPGEVPGQTGSGRAAAIGAASAAQDAEPDRPTGASGAPPLALKAERQAPEPVQESAPASVAAQAAVAASRAPVPPPDRLELSGSSTPGSEASGKGQSESTNGATKAMEAATPPSNATPGDGPTRQTSSAENGRKELKAAKPSSGDDRSSKSAKKKKRNRADSAVAARGSKSKESRPDRLEEIVRMKSQAFSETEGDRVGTARSRQQPPPSPYQFLPESRRSGSAPKSSSAASMSVGKQLAQCQQSGNFFSREKCKWRVCDGKWGKYGCPSFQAQTAIY